jgi:hypothetical protein
LSIQTGSSKEADRLVTRIDPGVVSLVAELCEMLWFAQGSATMPRPPTGDRGWMV